MQSFGDDFGQGSKPVKSYLRSKATVPAGAIVLPRSFVERAGVQEAVGDLIDPKKALAPTRLSAWVEGGKQYWPLLSCASRVSWSTSVGVVSR